MKRKGLSILLVMMVFILTACGAQGRSTIPSQLTANAQNAQTDELQTESFDDNKTKITDSNILIAYFSSVGNIETDEDKQGNVGGGNTKMIADLIQEKVDGELFFIETVDKYPANYNNTIDVAMQEQESNARPALASHVENMDDYDVIFVGYPIWWGTMPLAVLSFLDEYDLSGKTIIPFCTHEGSGFGRSIDDLKSHLSDSTFLEGFAVRGSSASDAEDDVTQWLSDLDLPE